MHPPVPLLLFFPLSFSIILYSLCIVLLLRCTSYSYTSTYPLPPRTHAHTEFLFFFFKPTSYSCVSTSLPPTLLTLSLSRFCQRVWAGSVCHPHVPSSASALHIRFTFTMSRRSVFHMLHVKAHAAGPVCTRVRMCLACVRVYARSCADMPAWCLCVGLSSAVKTAQSVHLMSVWAILMSWFIRPYIKELL